MKKWFKIILILIVAAIALEIGGYAGIILLSKTYQYSTSVQLSKEYVSEENPYLRLRKILMGVEGYLPRFYACYNLNVGLTPEYKMDGIEVHNADAYKGEKINCAKGAQYRILFLGGYPTYGGLKNPELALPAQTGKILNDSIKNL